MATAAAIVVASTFNSIEAQSRPLGRGGSLYGGLYGPDQYDALLGRRLKPTPPHLMSRVLYIPSHNDKVTHLPVYNFTDPFRAAVRDEHMGSIRFKTKLGLMDKPNGDGRGASEVSYLIDFEPFESRRSVSGPDPAQHRRRKSSVTLLTTRATVQRRSPYAGGGAEVGLAIAPASPLDDAAGLGDATGAGAGGGVAVACTMSPRSMTMDIPLVASFPIGRTTSSFGSSRNPWFTFTVPSLLDDERTLQWQVHPVEQGTLRFTLVEIPAPGSRPAAPDPSLGTDTLEPPPPPPPLPFSATEDENEHLVRAIYHNVGLGFSLSQPFSEGALLLQDDLGPELEALVVASLLGLLWRMRNEESTSSRPPRKGSKSDGGGRKGSVGAEPPATSSGRRRLFGRILGKK